MLKLIFTKSILTVLCWLNIPMKIALGGKIIIEKYDNRNFTSVVDFLFCPVDGCMSFLSNAVQKREGWTLSGLSSFTLKPAHIVKRNEYVLQLPIEDSSQSRVSRRLPNVDTTKLHFLKIEYLIDNASTNNTALNVFVQIDTLPLHFASYFSVSGNLETTLIPFKLNFNEPYPILLEMRATTVSGIGVKLPRINLVSYEMSLCESPDSFWGDTDCKSCNVVAAEGNCLPNSVETCYNVGTRHERCCALANKFEGNVNFPMKMIKGCDWLHGDDQEYLKDLKRFDDNEECMQFCKSFLTGCSHVTYDGSSKVCYIKNSKPSFRIHNNYMWCSSTTPLNDGQDLAEWNKLYCSDVVGSMGEKCSSPPVITCTVPADGYILARNKTAIECNEENIPSDTISQLRCFPSSFICTNNKVSCSRCNPYFGLNDDGGCVACLPNEFVDLSNNKCTSCNTIGYFCDGNAKYTCKNPITALVGGCKNETSVLDCKGNHTNITCLVAADNYYLNSLGESISCANNITSSAGNCLAAKDVIGCGGLTGENDVKCSSCSIG